MADFKPVSYWHKYRDIRKKVNKHVLAVHHAEASTESSSEESDNEHTMHYLFSEPSNDNTQAPHEVGSHSCPDTRCSENINYQMDTVSDGNINTEEVNYTNADSVHDGVPHYMENVDMHLEEDLSSSDSETDENGDLALSMAEWATKFGASHTSVNELLRILRPYHDCLPKDARTLLKTAKVYTIIDIAGGSYYHFGISDNVQFLLSSLATVESIEEISLQINIDGLPLFKSSNVQFWPILGRVVVPSVTSPFVIGLFVGNQKPADVSEYTQNLIQELDDLIKNGISVSVHEVNYQIRFNLSCVICDTPARAFVKCCKGHSGYFGCDKCSQKGVWKGKLTFPETDAPRRTDASFDEMLNVEHHLAPSPFRHLPIGMVSQFPLDYMHLVCLGVMKRLIVLWMKCPLVNNCRVGTRIVRLISDSLLNLKHHLPREFSRKGRPLSEMERWKASEFRQFLLYTGPIVLKNHLSSTMYKHFLLLFVAILCLSCDFLFETYCGYAHEILSLFVQQFGQIYGEDMVVYNVHSLVHLAEDARNFGILDNFSAFPFESFLGKLKMLVRKPSLPLQQVIRRMSEGKSLPSFINTDCVITAKKRHEYGPVPTGRHFQAHLQFKEVHLPDCYISIHQGNNCIMIDNDVALVRNILSQSEEADKLLVYEQFNNTSNFFTYPLQSMDLRVTKVWGLCGHLSVASVSSIICKCVLLPYRRLSNMYLLVEFTDNSELAVVPNNWLDGNMCAVWPPFKTSARLTKAVSQKEPPTESWQAYPIRVLYKDESYDKVRSKLKKAEVDSDLQTDTNESQNGRPLRRKRSPNRYSSSDSDEPVEGPRPERKTKAAKRNTQPCTLVASTSTLPTPPQRISTSSQPTPRQVVKTSSAASQPTTPQLISTSSAALQPTTPQRISTLSQFSPRQLVSTSSAASQPTPLQLLSPSSAASQSMASPTQSTAAGLTSSSTSLTSPKAQSSSIVARDVRLFTIIEKMREEQRHQTTLLTTILSKLGAEAEANDEMPEDISFPISTEGEMKSFDERIKDKYTEKLVVGHLAAIGGSSAENMAHRIFRHIVSNPLAEKYNWTGSKNKIPFRTLRLPLIVKRAVRRCYRLVTMADIETCTKSFLKSAKDRDGGRLKRLKDKHTPVYEPNSTAVNESSSEDSEAQ